MHNLVSSAWWRVSSAALLLAAAGVGHAARAAAQAEPYYWRSRVFFIPYQPNLSDPQAAKIDKVQLLVARDGSQQWAVLQEADPHVRGFSYHAAADGAYDFALRMSDRRGNLWPEQVAQPLLRIVVDTQPPQLQLAASLDATGQLVIRYEARDAKLKPQSLRLEAQADGASWQRVGLGPPDVNQPDRLLGQLSWKAPTTASQVRFRASIDDMAGNSGTSTADASLIGPVLDPAAGPRFEPPAFADDSAELQTRGAAGAPRSALDWPVDNSHAESGASMADSAVAPPPFANSYTSRGANFPATPGPSAQFIADSAAPSLLPSHGGREPPSSTGGWVAHEAPLPTDAPSNDATDPAPQNAGGAATSPWVNSLTFDVDYDIQTVGPWGVAKVELWGTKDGGRQWVSLGVDHDNRSPMRVTVPAAGVYGFRIIVDGGNGAAADIPQPGDAPELVVGVDLDPPQAELRAADPGQGALAGQLLIRWSAQDENLTRRPISLFYSSSAEGPWSTIATDIENAGEYAWRLGRDVPPRVFLRLEVRDVAGNVEVRQSPAAIDLNVPRPTGRLRNVRPVDADPSRYRTASGARPAES